MKHFWYFIVGAGYLIIAACVIIACIGLATLIYSGLEALLLVISISPRVAIIIIMAICTFGIFSYIIGKTIEERN